MKVAALFEALIGPLLDREGGYIDDPADSGGETNWGITVAVARAYGYWRPMREMTRAEAQAIYRDRYWDSQMLDKIGPLSPAIAEELFDTGVNQGVGAAGTYLQRALNALNNEGKFYPDTVVDGRIGPMTVAGLSEYLARRGKDGERVLLRALNSLQGAFYLGLAERRQKDERFLYGWFLNRVS